MSNATPVVIRPSREDLIFMTRGILFFRCQPSNNSPMVRLLLVGYDELLGEIPINTQQGFVVGDESLSIEASAPVRRPNGSEQPGIIFGPSLSVRGVRDDPMKRLGYRKYRNRRHRHLISLNDTCSRVVVYEWFMASSIPLRSKIIRSCSMTPPTDPGGLLSRRGGSPIKIGGY
jgi:hypothetical protein